LNIFIRNKKSKR